MDVWLSTGTLVPKLSNANDLNLDSATWRDIGSFIRSVFDVLCRAYEKHNYKMGHTWLGEKERKKGLCGYLLFSSTTGGKKLPK